MTTSPEPSSTRPTPRPVTDLEAGLTAVKQGNYASAIALLESAMAQSPSTTLANRAQMGLIIAYEKMGEPQRAVDLCRSLQESANSQVQEWATRTQTTLLKRHPELLSPDFQESTPQNPTTAIQTDTLPFDDEADITGFTPLTAGFPAADSAAINSTMNATGFALSQPSQQPSTAAPPTPARRSNPIPGFSQPNLSQAETQPQANPNRSQTDAGNDLSLPEPSLYQPVWRQAGRAQQWKALGKTNPLRLIGAQVLTAIALYFTIQQVLYWVAATYSNALLKTMPRLGFRWVQWGPPTWTIPVTIGLLVVALVASRWLLDALLIVNYGLQPLSLSTLATYSPETAQSLNRLCRKAGVAMPALGVLPTAAPVAFSYGVVPQVARTVVSQGLLEQLADDEIAAIYANEVGHLSTWTVPLMSAIAVVLQIPYALYRLVSEWGNDKDSPISRACAILIAAISYGLFWLFRGACLWLSRLRVHSSDRVAVDLTGNPNGYTRALLKIAIGTAKDVQQQGQTSYLLEGFDLLMPLGHRIAVPLGSLYNSMPLEPLLEQEQTNPYRSWLAINCSHPNTGERLHWLSLYARHWKLDSELDWKNTPLSRPKPQALSGRQWRSLLIQGAPYFGIVFGVLVALGFSFLGWVGQRLHLDYLSWMAGDRTLLRGLPLIGFSLGTFLRINPFFPDNAPARLQTSVSSEPTLPKLLQQPTLLPLASQTVQIRGKLLGRPGICNVLNQDLLLQTSTGLVKLHCTSRLGPLGLLLQTTRPAALIRQNLTAIGWFRQGSTSWIDVETLRTSGGVTSQSFHPVYATLAGAIAAALGILIILNP